MNSKIQGQATQQLEYVRQAVKQMRPGYVMSFARELLYFPVPPPWTPADWVLEGIVGSAYEFWYYRDHRTGNFIFRRRSHPVEGEFRTYVSADRRDRFDKLPSGLYRVKRDAAPSDSELLTRNSQ
jgi:hypothetical protein